MASTLIESKLKRAGGSVIPLGGIDYHFTPLADGAHVCEVANEDHADRFLSITEGFRLYRGDAKPVAAQGIVTQAEAAPAPVAAPEILLGGEYPASFTIHGTVYSLGDIVARAHEGSGLSVEAWNTLPQDERDGKIEAELDRIDAAGQQAATSDEERATLVDQYTKLYGEAPHPRTGVKKLRELIAAKQ